MPDECLLKSEKIGVNNVSHELGEDNMRQIFGDVIDRCETRWGTAVLCGCRTRCEAGLITILVSKSVTLCVVDYLTIKASCH